MGDEHFETILAAEPRVLAWPHTKRNELGGKLRAIYGVNVEHYIVASSVCTPIEALTRDGPLFRPSTSAGKMGTMLSCMQNSKQPGCWLSFDYSDFNMAHSPAFQQAVYLA